MQANQVVLDYEFTGAQGGTVKMIDIAHSLSLLNRKSYRSGYVYSVDYIEYTGSSSDEVTTVILPFTYPLINAYKLGFEEWKEQRAMAIDESSIRPGRWSDFKPWFNSHHFEGTWDEITPVGMTGVTLDFDLLSLTGSEWNRAELESNDIAAATTTTVNVGMLGFDDFGIGYGSLMNAYGDTRVATLAPDPLLPTAASTSWITRVAPQSGEMSQDVINLIENENDYPPYANEEDVTQPPIYNGGGFSAPCGMLMDKGTTGSTGRPISLNGGLVPLGLIAVRIVSSVGEDTLIRVHLTRGEYKGVAALPMGDFN